MRSSLLLYLWVFSSLSLHLQAQTMGFQHITTRDGLSDIGVTCILEDRLGYLWIGTERGLDRYDGQRIEAMSSAPLHITSIAEGCDGTVWYTTLDQGLYGHDPNGQNSVHFTMRSPGGLALPDDALNHVQVIDERTLLILSRSVGAIWFDTSKGVLRKSAFLDHAQSPSKGKRTDEKGTWCHSSLKLSDTETWVSCLLGYGAYLVETATGRVLRTMATSNGCSGLNPTHALLHDGALFVGGWGNGLQRQDPHGIGPPQCFLLDEEITSTAPWSRDELIIGTKLHGLIRMRTDGTVQERIRHHRNDPSSLANDHIRCLLRDRAGNLWVGTQNGLSVHAPPVWRFQGVQLVPDHVPEDLVFHALQQDGDGTVRISTSGGTFLVDPKYGTVQRRMASTPLGTMEVTGHFAPRLGLRYVGTEQGLYPYDETKETITNSANGVDLRTLPSGRMFQVRSVHWDTLLQGPRLIVGALGYGLMIIDPEGGALQVPNFPKDQPSHLLLRDTDRDGLGRYWVASGAGVQRWTPARTGLGEAFTFWHTSGEGHHHLKGNDATDLLRCGDTLWVALHDAGLARIIGDKAENFEPPSHLPNDAQGIARDGSGRIWYTSTNGLVRFDPRDTSWLNIPVNYGRRSMRLARPITLLADERLAFCTDNHLITFRPEAFDHLPELPEPKLVALRATWGDITVKDDNIAEIPYRSGAFDATLTALQTTGLVRLTFLYRIGGIEQEWRSTTAIQPLRYAGLPVGRYPLVVKVRDAYGREGPERVLLTVNVAAPFWQRWWFFALVFALGASGMYVVARYRLAQRLKLQALRDNIARDLHDDIGSTLGSINYYSEALKRKLEQVDDEMAREVADRIGNSSRSMIDQMNDIVWSVDPTKDDARSLEDRIRNFAADLTASKGIQLHFASERAMHGLSLGAQQRRNLFLIAKEAIHNCVKYAACTELHITLERNKDRLLLTVMDNGLGFDQDNTDSYNGNGLTNMARRAEAIGGELRVESTSGHGTRVTVSAPFTMAITRTGD